MQILTSSVQWQPPALPGRGFCEWVGANATLVSFQTDQSKNKEITLEEREKKKQDRKDVYWDNNMMQSFIRHNWTSLFERTRIFLESLLGIRWIN